MDLRLLLLICLTSFPLSLGHVHTYYPQYPAHSKTARVENYVPKGEMQFIESLNLTMYESQRNASLDESRLLIAVYDIFGYHDHIKQIVDTVAASKRGFRIVVPDFFHGTFFPGPVGSWEEGVDQDVANVIAHYQADGAESIGIFGFCWGGRISVKAGQAFESVLGVGLVHPGGVLTEDAESLQAHALLLPAGDDPNMDEFAEIVDENLGVGSVVHFRFDDMIHGFAGGSGDWSNPVINRNVDLVIEYLVNFFDEVLPSTKSKDS